MEVTRQDWMSDEVYRWAILEEQARINTLERIGRGGKKALVAIKAQHPLKPDGTPGPEYAERLEEAMVVKSRLEVKGLKAVFMTFGGVHEGHRNMSLADAGRQWLVQRGIAEEDIVARPVVFSGNDEDRIAAEYFASREEFSELHVVLSAGQWERARLYYIFMGWQPTMHPVTFLDAKPNHSTVCELWGAWAVPAFAKGTEAIAEMTDQIRKKHIDAAMK